MSRTLALCLSWGLFLTLLGPALLGAAWYAHEFSSSAGTELAVAGWVALVVGAGLLAGGWFARLTASEPASQ